MLVSKQLMDAMLYFMAMVGVEHALIFLDIYNMIFAYGDLHYLMIK